LVSVTAFCRLILTPEQWEVEGGQQNHPGLSMVQIPSKYLIFKSYYKADRTCDMVQFKRLLTSLLMKQFNVKKVYRWGGYVDDEREQNVVTIIEKAAKLNSLIPSFLCTIAIGEGFGLWIDDNYGADSVNVDYPVDGFGSLGLDHFGSDFNRTKKYLPDDYNKGDEFTQESAINEHGDTVQSAVFKNVKAGIQALSITLALRKQIFLSHSKLFGYIKSLGNPNNEQLAFWLYVYFQGEGRAKKCLELNKNYDYSQKAPSFMFQIQQLSLERLAAWKYLQSKRIFSS
jgi:hypothetical protein